MTTETTLSYVCCTCIEEYHIEDYSKIEHFLSASKNDRRVYYCNWCYRKATSWDSSAYPIIDKIEIRELGEENFAFHTLTHEDALELKALHEIIWRPNRRDYFLEQFSTTEASTVLNKFYASDASYNLKRCVTLDTAHLHPGAAKWGYENLWGPALVRLMEKESIKDEYVTAAVSNPNWTSTTLTEFLQLNADTLRSSTAINRFITQLPDRFITKEFIRLVIFHLPRFKIDDPSAIFARAKKMFDLEETLPDSWVSRILVPEFEDADDEL